jgi:hypothetical protein
MLHESPYYCPECDDGRDHPQARSRRDFMRAMGGTMALVSGTALSTKLLVGQEGSAPRKARPAEELIKELYSSLSESQRAELVYPWEHGQSGGAPTRLGTFNAPVFGKKIGEAYTKPQQELVKQILKSILSGDEAYDRLGRHNTWDNSGSFEGCGAVVFGDPTGKDKFSWVFAGHHVTFRNDGNSEPGAAFGGPMYYGHSANGYSDNNAYLFQTNQVHKVYDALSEDQRKKALNTVNPGDGVRAYRFRPREEAHPGIAFKDLSADQRKLVEDVMRALLSPFRKEDGDEVMQLIRANGGMEKVHISFFREGELPSRQRWDAWRLEGPGFVWNFRVLPHVHCFVNIATVS